MPRSAKSETIVTRTAGSPRVGGRDQEPRDEHGPDRGVVDLPARRELAFLRSEPFGPSGSQCRSRVRSTRRSWSRTSADFRSGRAEDPKWIDVSRDASGPLRPRWWLGLRPVRRAESERIGTTRSFALPGAGVLGREQVPRGALPREVAHGPPKAVGGMNFGREASCRGCSQRGGTTTHGPRVTGSGSAGAPGSVRRFLCLEETQPRPSKTARGDPRGSLDARNRERWVNRDRPTKIWGYST